MEEAPIPETKIEPEGEVEHMKKLRLYIQKMLNMKYQYIKKEFI